MTDFEFVTAPFSRADADYQFAAASADDGSPLLEAVKTWTDGDAQHEQRLPLAVYGMAAELDADRRELEDVRQRDGLEAAMQLAESLAVASGMLHDGRADPRLFTAGPPDPFTTLAELERTVTERDTQPLPRVATGADWFAAQFAAHDIAPLGPVDAGVNYGVAVQDGAPGMLEVVVEKYWQRPDDRLGIAEQIVAGFAADDPSAREQADAVAAGLRSTFDELGLDAMMHRAELQAMEHGFLDADRADLRLFRLGPPDRFETLAQRLEGEVNPYWNTDGPGGWDELIAQEAARAEAELPPEPHYWTLDAVPAHTPTGEPLGTALRVTAYPSLPPDFSGEPPPEAPALALTLAHFSSADAARQFAEEFHTYLLPGQLDGPALAEAVAQLEGLPDTWTPHQPGRPLICEADDWHLHNPNAEREAGERFTGAFAADDEHGWSPEQAAPDLEL